jgi:hypothetical protein
MILTVGKTLTLVLDAAATDTEPKVVAFCKDKSESSGKVTYPTPKETVTTGDTLVTIVSTPSEKTTREVTQISIFNHSTTASNTFEVKMTGGTTDPISIAKFTLLTLEKAVYKATTGWKCYKATGALKTTAHAAG